MRLVLRFDGQDIQEFVLDKGTVTIGRTSKNDIVIDNLSVSSLHASISYTDDAVVIEDMNSTNGITVNDIKINRHNLLDGDIIAIGKHQILFFTESAFSTAGSDNQSEATVMMSADFQKQLQDELSKNKMANRTVQTKKEEKGLWAKIKAMLGLG